MLAMQDVQNSHRDYGIEGKIWFGMTGLKNPIRSREGRPLSIEGLK